MSIRVRALGGPWPGVKHLTPTTAEVPVQFEQVQVLLETRRVDDGNVCVYGTTIAIYTQ